jgi:hypothetical protein
VIVKKILNYVFQFKMRIALCFLMALFRDYLAGRYTYQKLKLAQLPEEKTHNISFIARSTN